MTDPNGPSGQFPGGNSRAMLTLIVIAGMMVNELHLICQLWIWHLAGFA